MVLAIEMTREEFERIEALARKRGYNAPAEYVRALVEMDDEDDEADLTQEEIEANFRQAWHEAMTGQTYPIETLWDKLDDD